MVYAILLWFVLTTSLSIKPLCFQASKNTNMLSAPIPSTIYIITTYNEPKYFTWSTKSVIRTVIGKLRTMIVTPIREMKKERRWKFRQPNTNTTEKEAFSESDFSRSLNTSFTSFNNSESIYIVNPMSSCLKYCAVYLLISLTKAILQSF